MNKAKLAQIISEKLNIQKKLVEDVLTEMQEAITVTLGNDEDVTITGFGTFSSRIRGARKGVNPRKPSEMIDVPAVKVPKFKAGKTLKDRLKASMHKEQVSQPTTDDTSTQTQTDAPTLE